MCSRISSSWQASWVLKCQFVYSSQVVGVKSKVSTCLNERIFLPHRTTLKVRGSKQFFLYLYHLRISKHFFCLQRTWFYLKFLFLNCSLFNREYWSINKSDKSKQLGEKPPHGNVYTTRWTFIDILTRGVWQWQIGFHEEEPLTQNAAY